MADKILESLTARTLFDLRGVVAVVTGGGTGYAKGIGMMISSTLVANGATVYIIGPEQGDLDKRAASLFHDAASHDVPTWGRMYGLQGDIRLKSEATRLAAEVGKREQAVTVLFNNAGINPSHYERPPATAPAAAYVAACFDGVSQADFTDTLNTNAVGPYWLTFAFLPLLERWKAAAHGTKFAPQVVMTSSMNGWSKDPATCGFSFPYLFSKSALGHATASLAHELLPLGVRVNGIAPGLFPTQLITQSSDSLGRSTFPPGFNPGCEVPAGAGTPRDMGTLALFLVANWHVNGETVLIDGGPHILPPPSAPLKDVRLSHAQTLLKHPSSY
ncbi:NAD-P-binding protein [Mycena belliarum]|uniref:NAD-P-binding protein n=1 Tax=Mycena belliarum TaxID=1033014 RepID=A0AAD6TYC7_9AGAR|nr:NAD-P-binding protein [Mycena belliae]